MAGHNKWSQIKRKKAVTDSRRAKLWTKLLREIQIAAKMGGSPEGNPRLKTAILAAKSMSVPNDNIDRAIKRGLGETEGAAYEEITYEGYGSGGVAVLIKVLTDNKNRAVADIRHAFAKCHGNLGSSNSVAFQFEEKGFIHFSQDQIGEDELMEVALDAGALDVSLQDDEWQVETAAKDFSSVRDALEKKIPKMEAAIRMVPVSTVKVSGGEAQSVVRLIEMLEDLDDVQNVYTNAEFDDVQLEALNT